MMKTTELRVQNDRTISSKRANEPYGSWSENHHNHITGLSIVSDDTWSDITADFEVKIGDVLYLLTVEYSHGDSFGQSRGNLSYVTVYKDDRKAYHAAKLIERHYENYRNHDFPTDKRDLELELESGKIVNLGSTHPWFDYFGGLDYVNVQKLTVERI